MERALNLSPHFSLAEFTASQTAARLGIDNDLPAELLANARRTAEMLERIRAAMGGVPMLLTGGYRCQALNASTPGASATSDHVSACAADFHAPRFGSALDVSRFLAPRVDELGIGQLIYEFGGWVHAAWPDRAKPINRVLTINRRGTLVGIVGS